MFTRTFKGVWFGAASLAAYGLTVLAAVPARAWTPDPALSARLAAPVRVTTFQVRPPRGYAEGTIDPGGGAITAWAGAARADGRRPIVMFQHVLVPTGDGGRYTLAQAFAKFMGPNVRHYRSWACTPTEAGTISGVPFVRAHWSGIDVRTGRGTRGFNYMGRRGNEFFLLGSQDAADAPGALALAEASALTFRLH